LIGTGLSCNQAYIIDFGLAKRYRDPRTHLHIPFRADHHILTGTTSFASLNSHLGIEQSRRDDLESLAYILIYFLCSSLPWYNAKSSTHNQRNKITQMKVDTIPNLLAGLPNEFSVFLHYTRALDFEGKPDYAYMRKLFHDLRIREGHEDDDIFDWCLPMMSLDDQTHNNHMMIDGKPLSKKPDTGVGSSKRVFINFFNL
jgi:serine/threonine protein kinase